MSTDFPIPPKTADNHVMSWFGDGEDNASAIAAADQDGLISRMAKENLQQMRQSLRSAFLSPEDRQRTTLTNLTLVEDGITQDTPAAPQEQVNDGLAVAVQPEKHEAAKPDTVRSAMSEQRDAPLVVAQSDGGQFTPRLEITDAGAPSPFENIEKAVSDNSPSSQLLASLGLKFGPDSYQTWTWRQDGTRSTAIMNADGLTRIVSCRPDGKLSDCVKRDGIDLVRFSPNGEVFINAQFNRTA